MAARLFARRQCVEGGAHGRNEMLARNRLLHEVDGPGLHRFDRHRHSGLARKHDRREMVVVGAQPLHKRFDLAGTTRASLALYSDDSDIDAFFEGLAKVRKILL